MSERARWAVVQAALDTWDEARLRAAVERHFEDNLREGKTLDRDAVQDVVRAEAGEWYALTGWYLGDEVYCRCWCHAPVQPLTTSAQPTQDERRAALEWIVTETRRGVTFHRLLDDYFASLSPLDERPRSVSEVEAIADGFLDLFLTKVGTEEAWYAVFFGLLDWLCDALQIPRERLCSPLMSDPYALFHSWVRPGYASRRAFVGAFAHEVTESEVAPDPLVVRSQRWLTPQRPQRAEVDAIAQHHDAREVFDAMVTRGLLPSDFIAPERRVFLPALRTEKKPRPSKKPAFALLTSLASDRAGVEQAERLAFELLHTLVRFGLPARNYRLAWSLRPHRRDGYSLSAGAPMVLSDLGDRCMGLFDPSDQEFFEEDFQVEFEALREAFPPGCDIAALHASRIALKAQLFQTWPALPTEVQHQKEWLFQMVHAAQGWSLYADAGAHIPHESFEGTPSFATFYRHAAPPGTPWREIIDPFSIYLDLLDTGYVLQDINPETGLVTLIVYEPLTPPAPATTA